MLAVQGIYNGKTIKPLQPFPEKKKYKVIITFLEEIPDNQEINLVRNLSSQTDGLTFWNSEKEDLYQDYLEK